MRVKVPAIPLAGQSHRLVYLTEAGLSATHSVSDIPDNARTAVLVTFDDPKRIPPDGMVYVTDLHQSPHKAVLSPRDRALLGAHAGVAGGWIAEKVRDEVKVLLERHPTSDARRIERAQKEMLKKQFDGEDIFEDSGLSISAIDRRRRLRWAGVLRPTLKDVGVTQAHQEILFVNQSCDACTAAKLAHPTTYTLDIMDPAAKEMFVFLSKAAKQPLRLPALWSHGELLYNL